MARHGIWYHPTTGKAVHLWEGFDPWCFFLPPFIPMAVRGIWLGPGAVVATLMVDLLVTGLGAVLAGPTGAFIAGLCVRFWYGANANSYHWMHLEARGYLRIHPKHVRPSVPAAQSSPFGQSVRRQA